MAVNKVVYGTTTLVDLTEDTVTADSLLEGATAHNATGEKVTGVLKEVTFDNTPTSGSQNAVTSDGIFNCIYDALQLKQDTLTFDTAPTSGSTNPVTSAGVNTAVNNAMSTAYNQAAARVYRGTATTANSTDAKVVTCNGFALSAGAVIDVYFTYGHVGGGTMTLNVNGTGAKTCYFANSSVSPTIDTPSKYCSAVVKFCYTGTYFVCIPTVVSESRSVTSSSPWWYRKWSDGFIEQGATVQMNKNTTTAVTFPTAFRKMVQSLAMSYLSSVSRNDPLTVVADDASTNITGFTESRTGFTVRNTAGSAYTCVSYEARGY